MIKTHAESRLLSRADVAEMFGVSPSTVTRWADAGLLPTAKTLGGHRRYDAAAVSELARQFQKEKPTMEELVFGVPAMWADHHVLAVRNALFALAGVDNVEASSAFKTVRVVLRPRPHLGPGHRQSPDGRRLCPHRLRGKRPLRKSPCPPVRPTPPGPPWPCAPFRRTRRIWRCRESFGSISRQVGK